MPKSQKKEISTASTAVNTWAVNVDKANQVFVSCVPSTTAAYTLAIGWQDRGATLLSETLVNAAGNVSYVTTAARTAYTDALNVSLTPGVTAAQTYKLAVFEVR